MLDAIDVALLRQMLTRPKVGMREYARELGLARATVQSRMDRLETSGAVTTWAPTLSPEALGFTVMALVHVHLRQGALNAVSDQMAAIPHILEAFSTTGDADLFCRVVARDHTDLETVIQEIIAIEGVVRTRSEIALSERVHNRVLPIVDLVAEQAPQSARARLKPAAGQIERRLR
jgi:DNA-binding Lrp family transcriptional regulator